jgi:hypothetical protein
VDTVHLAMNNANKRRNRIGVFVNIGNKNSDIKWKFCFQLNKLGNVYMV